MTTSPRVRIGGTSDDQQILGTPVPDLAEWICARVRGADPSWNPRGDDDPAALLRFWLRERSDDVRDRLIWAIAHALGSLSTDLASPEPRTFNGLLDLAEGCGWVPGLATRRLVVVLDALLRQARDDARVPKAIVDQLLIARGALTPATDPDLWKPYLNDRELAIAAFRCAMGARSPDDRTAAFVQLAKLDGECELPGFLHQARLLRRRVHPTVFESCIRSLVATGGVIGDRARVIALEYGVSLDDARPAPPVERRSNTNAQVAAFFPPSVTHKQ